MRLLGIILMFVGIILSLAKVGSSLIWWVLVIGGLVVLMIGSFLKGKR